ncbi:MAG TPA: HlyD family efflux transporter periplasmic adaptor subunit [Steroidobacteraceae bacterium]|nr:HlyD family efflux transporter periplasmic adaptor subunit [Steroidobacteraceae bacterium]
MSKKKLLMALAVVVVVGAGVAWWLLSKPKLPPGFAGGNGRLEAQAINVSAKYAGRLKTVIPREGDTVEADQVVATIDTEPLEAQLRAAKAQIIEAQNNLRTAHAQVNSTQAQLNLAMKEYRRAEKLVATGAISTQERDADHSKVEVSQANLAGYQAQVTRAQSAIDAQTAESERLEAEIKDNTLRAPVRARVQARMHEPGEVVAQGAPVLSLLDLSDVYMYVFLPTNAAGKVTLGSEARIVLDAIPEYPIRAVVSFVSPNAQFTPKTVETAEERHNLTFKVKLQLDRERLRQYEPYVKAGLPGMGYVRYFDNTADWPANLQPKPVSQLPWAPTGSSDSKPADSKSTESK